MNIKFLPPYMNFALKFLIINILTTSMLFASKDSNSPIVTITTVTQSKINSHSIVTGTVTSTRVSRISSQISGLAKTLHYKEGDQVSKNNILVSLDSELQQLSVDAAHQASVQAKHELDDAKRRLENAKSLKHNSLISDNEFDLLLAEVMIKQASLDRHNAEENKQRAILQRYNIHAPFSGMVSIKFKEVGEWISPGEPVLELISLEQLRAEFRIDQKIYPKIYENQRIVVSSDVNPDITVSGVIKSIIHESNSYERTFIIHVPIDQNTLNVMPGMSVRGRINLSNDEAQLTIPQDAVIRDPDGSTQVWTVKNNKVSQQIIELGERFEDMVIVKQGLNTGDKVVTRGNESLQEGQTVRIRVFNTNN